MTSFPTIAALKNSPVAKLNKHLFADVGKMIKKSKYGNEIIEFDNKSFRSKKELGKYVSLRVRQTAGEITDLQTQVPFELNPGGTYSLVYIADFVWNEKGKIIVFDTKGYKTKLYLKNKKLMLEVHGIHITEA